jgi:adenylate cyclase
MRGAEEFAPPKKAAAKKEKEVRVRFPIGVKLVVIITILLLVSLGAITMLVSWMVSEDTRLGAEDNNFDVNKRMASETEFFLNSVNAEAVILLDSFTALGEGADLSRAFEQIPHVAAVLLARADRFGNLQLYSYINETFFDTNSLDSYVVDYYAAASGELFLRVLGGETIIENVTPQFNTPLLAMFFPHSDGGAINPAIVLFSADTLLDNYGTGNNSSFLINDADDILVHPDSTLMSAGASMRTNPFVRNMRVRTDENYQTNFADEEGVNFFGAFKKLSLANAVVITMIPETLVFESVEATTRRNLYLSGAVLFLSMLFIYLFSKTISRPIRSLSRAANRIENGNFNLQLQAKNNDEIGVLTTSFVRMGQGLAERERLKDTFGRFVNKSLAEQAMRGELKLGGENKSATIFFSDIRSFTAISEKLQPNEVVEFLNDYMTRMVACVTQTNGVVDKYIGDSVMAVWGAPTSAGSSAEDALNCVKAALMMRTSLHEFNIGRGGDKKPIIKIGCGVNTGDIIAGQIGSSERMEYTVIGDAVNLASRTEALNKPFGTDILITENTWDLIKDHIITEDMPPVTVKGKEKPVRMFAVINLRSVPQLHPTTLAEVRATLHIDAPDLSKVDVNSEEKKYKIGGG